MGRALTEDGLGTEGADAHDKEEHLNGSAEDRPAPKCSPEMSRRNIYGAEESRL